MCLVTSQLEPYIALWDIPVVKMVVCAYKQFETMYRRTPVLLDQFLYAEGKYVLNKDNITQNLGPGLIHAYTRFCYASYYLQLRSDRIALKAYIPKGTRFFVSDDHETIAADKIFISSDKVTRDYGLTEEQIIILLGTHKNGTEAEKR